MRIVPAVLTVRQFNGSNTLHEGRGITRNQSRGSGQYGQSDGGNPMSVATSGTPLYVSWHAVDRYLQRVGYEGAHANAIAHKFRQGIEVDVEDRRYTEARLVQIGGTLYVFLRCDTHITTLLYAREEEITFSSARPDLECKDCGKVRHDAVSTESCACCKSREWIPSASGCCRSNEWQLQL